MLLGFFFRDRGGYFPTYSCYGICWEIKCVQMAIAKVLHLVTLWQYSEVTSTLRNLVVQVHHLLSLRIHRRFVISS